MKKIIMLICALLIPIKLQAIESYVVMDSNTARVLEGKNINEKMLIASTTKIMTAIVALENSDVTNIICAGDEIEEVYGSMIYLKKGECMNLYDLLVGLMLRSGNDAAEVIAVNTLGLEIFVQKMNETALKLGMKNTLFENPHGLDDKNKNISTAYDLALLMRYATQNKTFMEITKIKKYDVSSNLNTHLWYNKNKLLSLYKFATGGKIGYTTKSGHIFVSSASRANENLIVVTMKDDDQFNNHKKLYEMAFKKYDNYKILDKYTFAIKEDYYKDYHLYIKEDLNAMLKKEELNKIDLKIDLIKKKDVKNNDIVGYAKIYISGEYLNEVSIYALTNKKNMSNFINKILDLFKNF